MLPIIGALVVLGSVVIGYTAHDGQLGVLWQPTEFIIIFGAALGSMLISSPPAVLKALVHQTIGALKTGGASKEQYVELLMLLFELCKTAKANPLSLEPHVEKPAESEIFKKYPGVLGNHHAVDFLCDTLKVQISAPMSPYDLEDLMDADINTMHAEENIPPGLISKIGDAMPGLGIVAAVLGVVITMGKLTQGKEVIGHSVAAALVGTFIGILASYGFIQPLSSKMDLNNSLNGRYFSVIKAALLAYAKDASPKVCVEFARRTIPPESRPSFEEVDQATSGVKKAA